MPRILIVDDDANIRAILRYRFEKEDFTVDLAENGADALRRVDVQTPDLIILDLMMPEMDGLEFLSALRSGPRTDGIPVIVLTALGRDPYGNQTNELGATDVVTKPFSPRHLVEQVRKALNGKCGDGGHAVSPVNHNREQHGLDVGVRPCDNGVLTA